jgi:biotin carboxylase
VSGRLLLLLPGTTYRASAFLEAARRIGCPLTVGLDHHATLETAQPEGFLALDFTDPARAARQALAFHRHRPLAAVAGVDDETAAIAAHVAGAVGVPGNPADAAEAARDKALQRLRLRDAGVRVPAFTILRRSGDFTRAAGAASYPCVMKPTRLSASRGVIRADDRAAFVAAGERIRRILAGERCGEANRILVEQYVPGEEVALEGLLVEGALTTLALFDKPDPLEGPYFEESIYVTPSRLPAATQEAVMATVAQAAAALGLRRGPVHAELRVNAEGAWLIEVAARPIGGRCSAVLRFGPDGATSLEELVLRAALGQPVSDLRREPRAAAVMMIPVPGRGRLEAVEGLDDARRVAGVAEVVITAHHGQELVPPPEGAQYPGFIFARAADPGAAVEAVRSAHACLRFRLA